MAWKQRSVWIVVVAVALAACELSEGGAAGSDAGPDVPDVAREDAEADTAEVDTRADAEDSETSAPSPLSFEVGREPAGEPVTDAEVDAFTDEMTSFWEDTGYFRWIRFMAHGMHPGNEEGYPDYAMWWTHTTARKEGDTVTYVHENKADNIELRVGKVLSVTLPGYLATGHSDMGWVARQLSKGLVAMAMGMEWGEDDPEPYIQSRAIFTHNHSYEMEGGRKVVVDYSEARTPKVSSVSTTLKNPDNPYWGEIWVRNQRSKDDVPHMFRAVPWMMRVAEEAPDEDVRAAAAKCLEYMRGFAKDIVESGYLIRTKAEDGAAHVPKEENGAIKDLASFVSWEEFVPDAECTAKLVTALVAEGEPLENDCGKGFSGEFETIAAQGNYYNYAIIRYFHVAAMYMAMVEGHDEVARELMVGLAERMDGILHDEDLPHYGVDEWWPDAAAILLASAAAGLPLTNEEARLIQEEYTKSAEHYRNYAYWDPWDDAVPDGEYDYLPMRGVDREKPRFGRFVRATTMGYLIEYCASPYRHPDGAPVVDCDRVLDPEGW